MEASEKYSLKWKLVRKVSIEAFLREAKLDFQRLLTLSKPVG